MGVIIIYIKGGPKVGPPFLAACPELLFVAAREGGGIFTSSFDTPAGVTKRTEN